MSELDYLRDLVVIMGIGVAIVALFHRLKIPTIAGFIVAGILVGPNGFGFVDDMHHVQVLSEIGVTLLLFGIGLELPLDRIRRIWKPILIGGFFQVGLTISAVYFIAAALGMAQKAALLTGFVIAVSSTAIVLKGLGQRGEIDAPHGRFIMGILIFQDLCVIPMMMMIPLLGEPEGVTTSLVSTLLRSILIIAAVLTAAWLVVPKLLEIVARTRQRHLFVMTILLVCIGTAWVSARAGVSLALGAFLAGLVVGGSGYRHQAMADIFSFRELFISIFFVSVGMLLDLGEVLPNIAGVLALLITVIIGKFLLVFIAGLCLRAPLRICAMAGTALAQIGEFSFIMLGLAVTHQLISPTFANNLLATAVFSMLLTPFALSFAPTLAAGLGKFRLLTRLLDVTSAVDAAGTTTELKDHIIIGGYGLVGHDLAKALRASGTRYVIVDINPENVRLGIRLGEPIFYGDITSPEVLGCLGAAKARVFVIVVNDHGAIERSLKATLCTFKDLHVLVRTRYLQDIPRLTKAGAAQVVAEEVVTSAEIVNAVMQRTNRREPVSGERG